MAANKYIETPTIRALRVLIDFAEGPTRNLAPLRHAGKTFLAAPALAAVLRLTPPQIDKLKADLRQFLRLLASRTADEDGPRLPVTIIPAVSRDRVIGFVDGDPRAALLYQVFTLVEKTGIDRLRLCPSPDCGKLFVKVGRREHCGDRCTRRMFLKDYDPFAAQRRRPAKPLPTKKGRQR